MLICRKLPPEAWTDQMEIQCEVIHFGSQSKEALSVRRGTVLLLELKSSVVIGLRIAELARGGADAQRAAHLIVS